MKNNMEGEIIKARRLALLCMKHQGIVPLHQIIDSKMSRAYKDDIRETRMTYQLVPPDEHRHSIAEVC